MQNRYVGDIGDYVKYALLRRILEVEGGELGIAWYLYPDETDGDGGHTEYLRRPKSESWRHLDPELFGKLRALVDRNERCVSAIQQDSEMFGGDVRFFSEMLRPPHTLRSNTLKNHRARGEWRRAWFDRLSESLDGCNVVFADPDNGLFDSEHYRYGTVEHWKRTPLREVEELASNGRTVVVYHHHRRFYPGGNNAEIRCWLRKLGRNSVAVRSGAWSSRSLFVVNPSARTVGELSKFAARSPKLSFHDSQGTDSEGVSVSCVGSRFGENSESYRSRIKALCADAADEGYSVRSESERGFWKFVSGRPNLRRGSVVLMDNGNLRAVWKDGQGAHLGLQFLGEGMVQYVIFKRRSKAQHVSRVAGRDTLTGLLNQIDAFQLQSLLYE